MNYKNWKLDWEQIWYYKDGSIRFKWDYKNWKWTVYYYNEDWSLLWTAEETYTDKIDEDAWEYESEINWLSLTYYNNGQLANKENYKDWKLDWTQISYYENGQIESICEYNKWIKWECSVYDENWEKIS